MPERSPLVATITALQQPPNNSPRVTSGGDTPFIWRANTATSATEGKLYAAQNDVVNVLEIPRGMVVADAYLAVSATLGASCTAQLRRGTTALTAATTAAAAGLVRKS